MSWLNPRRIRRQASLLAIALWLGFALTLATPGMRDRFSHLKGADFLHAYVLGSIALDHRAGALYDATAQRAIGERLVPASAGDYFLPVYGPQYSLIWMPFALLPYPWAAALWMLLSAAIYAACCYAIWRTCPNLHTHASTVALAAAAFPGFFSLITFGQNSALALAAFTAAYFALHARRNLLAGFCLGLLAFKPQLAIVPAFVFTIATLRTPKGWPGFSGVGKSGTWNDFGKDTSSTGCGGTPVLGGAALQRCDKRPASNAASAAEGNPSGSITAPLKPILGAVLCLIVQFAVTYAWYGRAPFLTYAHVLTHIGSAAKMLEPRPYLMHSLRAFWNLLLPWPSLAFGLYILTASSIVGLAIAIWQAPAPLHRRFAVMLLATVLIAPHLTVYDLVILAPAFLWIADALAADPSPRLAWLLYLSFLLPFAGPLAIYTHLQVSVICLAALTLAFAADHSRSIDAACEGFTEN